LTARGAGPRPMADQESKGKKQQPHNPSNMRTRSSSSASVCGLTRPHRTARRSLETWFTAHHSPWFPTVPSLLNSPLANILVIDDRAEDRAALEAVLAPLGQNLVLAESGKDALRHILKTEFAVILLDVEMPIMDGLETARMIRQRERSQQIPIIFITGVAVTSVERFRGYAAGAVDYMPKPAIPDILRWKVRVFVDLYRLKAVLEDQIRSLGVANQALLEALAERDQSEQERAKLATEVKP